MHIQILNLEEDQHGNSKENIFIALSGQGDYLGSAFTYPAINHHQAPETPYLIYISVDPAAHSDPLVKDEASRMLFEKVLFRARELRAQRPDLTARIYAGFEPDQEQLDFYLGNGFEENYSIMMECCIPDGFTYTLPEDIAIAALDLSSDKELTEYKERYDGMFVTPLDLEALAEQAEQPHFHNLMFIKDGRLQGGCTFYAQDGCGYIETVYVMPEARGTGISRTIMNYIFDYFSLNGLSPARLEVWELNTRAVRLYRSLGFTEAEKKIMFPGITLAWRNTSIPYT